ncbi:MAG: SH3 domain-containing protein [Desulfuromonadales bacterium]|nr:SH3 domain-containing protein [Desulfuromonadales bacterium]
MTRTSSCLLLLLFLLTLPACRQKPPPLISGVADLSRYEQRVSAYAQSEESLLSTAEQQVFDALFNQKFFAPWRLKKASLSAEKAFWGIKHYEGKSGFAENLLPMRHEEWQRLIALQQLDSYPSLARPAITVRNTSLRLLPTERPFFLDPQRAGEGFPFDYFQTSALAVGNPVFATHGSSDGAWIFVECNFAFGWVPQDAIAWVKEPLQRRYENAQYAAILHDDTSLRSAKGDFLAQADLGAIFPLAKAPTFSLYVPVRDADGNAELRTAVANQEDVALKPLALTPAAIARLSDPLMGQTYGWGGLFGNRDCSSNMRDLFVPFGIWLGRNSANQGEKSGVFIDLRNKSAAEKELEIVAKGIPFVTLIWLKGHIGLYLGTAPGSTEPLFLHNIWGIRTVDKEEKEGREIVGRLVITSLRPGEERPDVRMDDFYSRVQGMAILTGQPEK